MKKTICLADDHVHSTSGSSDARSSVTELCRLAVELGLCRICFTEHLDFDVTLPEYGYYQYEVTRRAIEEAREQFGAQLEIRMGLEVDFAPQFMAEIPPVVAKYPVDFVLGSVHVYDGLHFSLFRTAGRAVMPAEELGTLYRQYFAETRQMIQLGVFDCVAHMGYPAKVGIRAIDDAPIPGYAEALEETLVLAATSGIGLEINTKRSRTGAPLAATEEAVLRYVALGGRCVTLGADTHQCSQLGDGLELGAAVLQKAGLDYQTVFRQRRAEQLYFER